MSTSRTLLSLGALGAFTFFAFGSCPCVPIGGTTSPIEADFERVQNLNPGDSFKVKAKLSNSKNAPTVLEKIEIPMELQRVLDLRPVDPVASRSELVGNKEVFYFSDIELAKGDEVTITFDARAVLPGRHSESVSFCRQRDGRCGRDTLSVRVSGAKVEPLQPTITTSLDDSGVGEIVVAVENKGARDGLLGALEIDSALAQRFEFTGSEPTWADVQDNFGGKRFVLNAALAQSATTEVKLKVKSKSGNGGRGRLEVCFDDNTILCDDFRIELLPGSAAAAPATDEVVAPESTNEPPPAEAPASP